MIEDPGCDCHVGLAFALGPRRGTLDLVPKPVTVGLLADTHGVLDPRVLDALQRCDVIVHAGDVGSAVVLDALATITADLYAVVGNNDVAHKWVGSSRALARLVDQHALALPGGTLAVRHGHRVLPAGRRHERLRALHPDARAIVYGHSHRRVVDDKRRPWVLNPGAAGRARTFGGPSALRLRAGVRVWRVEPIVFDAHAPRSP